jgi:hypothetical protein
MPRRRGAVSGLLIVLAGVWCAAIPFIGHYLDLVIGPDRAWDMTAGRFWLSLVPGIVAVVGGLMLMRSANRASATLGAQLALAAGVWLVIGRSLSLVWTSTWAEPPLGGTTTQALELLLYFYGTGVLITALAGIALGRVSARHAGDVERLTGTHAAAEATGRGPAAGRDRDAGAVDRDGDGVPDAEERGRSGRFSDRPAGRTEDRPEAVRSRR